MYYLIWCTTRSELTFECSEGFLEYLITLREREREGERERERERGRERGREGEREGEREEDELEKDMFLSYSCFS